MLIIFLLLYLFFNLLIGIWAARRVKNNTDYLLAGRKLSFPVATAVVFATWFGSETILGASSEFAQKGVLGIIEDPFGAALCLVLVGLFFARKLYPLNLLTFGDFYKVRYNRSAELLASFFLVISYFGWIAAQLVALGIIFNLTLGISLTAGTLLGFIIVVAYTFMGGMWSVSVTDFIQTIVIVGGLIFITGQFLIKVPVRQVLGNLPPDFFNFTPAAKAGLSGWLNYFGLWITIGLGSIPQQDVFQRVMAARSENVAVYSSLAAGLMYLTIGLLPLILALYAKVLQPELIQNDPQLLLPGLILMHSPEWVKVLFFGALISAIMSTASGAILAPAAILSQNIFKPLYKQVTDKKLLWFSRFSVLLASSVSLVMALMRQNIYELVSESSALSLVSLFVPLLAGLYLPRTGPQAAIWSMLAGMGIWLLALALNTHLNPLLYGLAASVVGLSLGLFFYPATRNVLVK